MVKLIWMVCLMVLSLEVTNSWKYDRRELKELIMGEIYDILSSFTSSKVIATITKTNERNLSFAARPTFCSTAEKSVDDKMSRLCDLFPSLNKIFIIFAIILCFWVF